MHNTIDADFARMIEQELLPPFTTHGGLSAFWNAEMNLMIEPCEVLWATFAAES